MATLQADDIVDLITITQKDLGKMRWTDLSYDLQEYVALPSLLQKEKVALIRAAINDLPENQRIAVILKRHENFSYT